MLWLVGINDLSGSCAVLAFLATVVWGFVGFRLRDRLRALLTRDQATSCAIYRLKLHPLAKYSGPWLAAVTDWWTILHLARGDRHLVLYELHQRYGKPFPELSTIQCDTHIRKGKFVRYGSNRISINSVSALGDIYNVNANVQKSRVYGTYKHFFADEDMSKTTFDRKEHAYKRRINAQALSLNSIKSLEGHILKNIRVFFKNLLDLNADHKLWNAPRDMSKEIGYLVADIMGDVTFSKNWNTLEEPQYRSFVEDSALGTAGIHLVSIKLQTFWRSPH